MARQRGYINLILRTSDDSVGTVQAVHVRTCIPCDDPDFILDREQLCASVETYVGLGKVLVPLAAGVVKTAPD